LLTSYGLLSAPMGDTSDNANHMTYFFCLMTHFLFVSLKVLLSIACVFPQLLKGKNAMPFILAETILSLDEVVGYCDLITVVVFTIVSL